MAIVSSNFKAAKKGADDQVRNPNGTDLDFVVTKSETDQEGQDLHATVASHATLSREEEDLRILELVNTPALPPLSSTEANNWNCRKRSRANSYVWRRNDDNNNNSNNSVSIGTNSGEKRQRTTTLRPSSAAGKMVIPPEFHCPMCKRVMQDAMFVTKCCCFGTYCEGCIRGRLTTARSCACGAVDVGVDDLVPNVAIRKMIARVRAVIQSNCSSSSSDSSTVETN